MKKIIYLVAALATMCLVSCQSNSGMDVNDPNEYCWEVNVEAKIQGMGAEIKVDKTVYVWGTAAEIQEYINDAKQQAVAEGATVTITSSKSNIKNEDACDESNDLNTDMQFPDVEYPDFDFDF